MLEWFGKRYCGAISHLRTPPLLKQHVSRLILHARPLSRTQKLVAEKLRMVPMTRIYHRYSAREYLPFLISAWFIFDHRYDFAITMT